MKTTKYLPLILSLLLPLSAVAAQLSPENVVLDFYRLNLQDPPSDGYAKSQDLYVSPALQESISESLSCNFDGPGTDQAFCDQPRPCKETEYSYICLWGEHWVENDVNYYTKSQDYPDSWMTERAAHTESQTPDTATVRITLGKAPEPLRSFRVKFIQVQTALQQGKCRGKIASYLTPVLPSGINERRSFPFFQTGCKLAEMQIA